MYGPGDRVGVMFDPTALTVAFSLNGERVSAGPTQIDPDWKEKAEQDSKYQRRMASPGPEWPDGDWAIFVMLDWANDMVTLNFVARGPSALRRFNELPAAHSRRAEPNAYEEADEEN